MSERVPESEQIGILVWGEVWGAMATFLAPLVIVRLLGVSQVGAFATLMMTYELIVAVFASGLPRLSMYYLANRTPELRYAVARQLLGLMLRSGVFAGITLVVVGLLFGAQSAPLALLENLAGSQVQTHALAYLPFLGVFALVDLPTRVTPSIFLGEGRPRVSAGLETLRAVGMVTCTLIPAALGAGVGGILLGLMLFGMVSALVHASIWRGVFAHRGRISSGISSKEIIRNALPLAAHQIVSKMLSGTDLWIVLTLCGQVAVGIYAQGAWMIPMLSAILWSAGPVYIPLLARHFEASEPEAGFLAYRRLIERSATLIIPIALILVVNAEDFVALAYGEAYAPAAAVLRVYCLRHFFRVANLGSVLVAAGRPAWILRVSACTLLFNFVVSLSLVHAIGPVGAAIGTLSADIFEYGLCTLLISRAVRVQLATIWPWRAMLRIWLFAIIAGSAAVLVRASFTVGPAFGLSLTSAMVLAIYAALGHSRGQIGAQDWAYLWRWLSLRMLRSSKPSQASS